MKIQKPIETTPIAGVNAERPATERAEKGAAPVSDRDSVSLSERTRDLQRIATAQSAEPTFDAAKVEQLKGAIASGTFKVDTGKVADGLINSVVEMLSRRRDN